MLEQSTTSDQDVIFTDKHRVSCDGGGGALGHPLVWYSLDEGEAICGYCGRKFVLIADGPAGGGH